MLKHLRQTSIPVLLVLLVACGGHTNVSHDQQVYESLEFTGGAFGISWNLPYGGGNLVSGTHYIYSTSSGGLSVSPAQGGPQVQTPYFASLDPDLAMPPFTPVTYLSGGKPVSRNAADNRRIHYVGTAVQVDYLADDGVTVLNSVMWSDFTATPLNGYINNAPDEFQAAVPVGEWINANNFAATAMWQSGAQYVKRQAVAVSDTYTIQNCGTVPNVPTTTPGTIIPCPSSGTLQSAFPVVLYGTSWPIESYAIGDGTLTTVQGLPMWVANAPRDDGTFRMFYLTQGVVNTGYLVKAGTPQLFTNFDGTTTHYSIALNQVAVTSIRQALITGATVAGSQAGNTDAVSQIDLFGIGAHGINGSLAPADLRSHYDVPAGLDGSGQTIAIVDGPGTGNVLDDLNTYSAYFGLPQCNAANPCFQEIDLTNGAPVQASNNFGTEIALDTQMVHAMAPGAHIVLIIANDLLQGVNYAATLPGVNTVSMSFSLFQSASSQESLADLQQDQLFAAAQQSNGIIFLAASGDAGNYATYPVGALPFSYPAASPYVTAVGGTRINSVNRRLAAQSEVGWVFSGGGSATGFAMPAWQINFPNVSALNSYRAVPDVAAVADFQHSAVSIYHQQHWQMAGGTSASTPIWAGVTALLGQHMGNQGQSLATLVRSTPGGFNGLLYQTQLVQGAQPALIGITSGSNNLDQPGCSNCSATPGFNDVTGLGVPDVSQLLTAL